MFATNPAQRAEWEEVLNRAQSRWVAFAELMKQAGIAHLSLNTADMFSEVMKHFQVRQDQAKRECERAAGEVWRGFWAECGEEERQLFRSAGWVNPPDQFDIPRWVAICRQYGVDPDPLTLGEVKDMVLARLELVRVEELIRVSAHAQRPAGPPPAPQSDKAQLEHHVLELRAKGIGSKGKILAYLDSPEGRDLKGIAARVLAAEPKVKGSGGKRKTLEHVIGAALKAVARRVGRDN